VINAIATHPSGDIFFAGTSNSYNFLGSAGVPTRDPQFIEQGFLGRLSADGSTLAAFRYLGSEAEDSISSIAVLGNGDVVATGGTQAITYPGADFGPAIPYYANQFLSVWSADTLSPKLFSFIPDPVGVSLNLATSGARVWLLTVLFNSPPVSCPEGPNCSYGVVSVDIP
jgi:hypothetical protein